MPSIVPKYEYDIFISYRQKDNRSDQWVTNFVTALQEEIDATFKEDISIYFDSNPHDGLHETHDVDGSLKEKVKCLIFIPIVSRTYCDPKAFAWQKEFLPFLEFAKQDKFGLDIKLQGGNVAKRVLPIRIHELPPADRKLIEDELQGPLRSIDFIYQSTGVNRPLTPKDDERELNAQKTFYKDQLNKVANAIHDIISTMQLGDEVSHESVAPEAEPQSSTKKVLTKPKRTTSVKLPTVNKETRIRLFLIVLFVALVAMSLLYFLTPQKNTPAISATILPPENNFFNWNLGAHFAISPDGSMLAFVTRDSTGKQLLWLRRLDDLTGKPMDGTDEASFPFWSPDSQFIGYFAQGKLKKISASGGPSLSLCDVNSGRGGTWNKDGLILFCPGINAPLHKVKDTGGTPIPITRLDSVAREGSHRWPHFLPDGQRFFYTSRGQNPAIFIGSLDTTFVPQLIVNSPSGAEYANGHLLFEFEESLLAQPFDAKRLKLDGNAIPIASGVYFETLTSKTAFSLSRNGILVFQEKPSTSQMSINWYNRDGTLISTIKSDKSIQDLRISPDGDRVAVSKSDLHTHNLDIWIYEMERQVWNRLTFHDTNERWPVWTSDGNTILFASNQIGDMNIYKQKANGSESEVLVYKSNEDQRPRSLSLDGNYLAYTELSGGNYDILIKHLNSNKSETTKESVFAQSEFNETWPSFSPDGRWIAYQSDESNRDEIYLRSFPDPGGKWQVSVDGGTRPHWRKDSKEIYFLDQNERIMAVSIDLAGTSPQIGNPRPLFTVSSRRGSGADVFDVTPNGDKFVVIEQVTIADFTPISLVVNWMEKIKQKE